MIGAFPYICTRCGVRCECVEELADPEHHREVWAEQ